MRLLDGFDEFIEHLHPALAPMQGHALICGHGERDVSPLLGHPIHERPICGQTGQHTGNLLIYLQHLSPFLPPLTGLVGGKGFPPFFGGIGLGILAMVSLLNESIFLAAHRLASGIRLIG